MNPIPALSREAKPLTFFRNSANRAVVEANSEWIPDEERRVWGIGLAMRSGVVREELAGGHLLRQQGEANPPVPCIRASTLYRKRQV